MKKQEREFWMALAAIVISVAAAVFTGLQWHEAKRTRIEVHQDAKDARDQAEHQFELARQDARSASEAQATQVQQSAGYADRSAKAAEKSASAASKTSELNRRMFEISERAQVHIKDMDIIVAANQPAKAHLHVENVGKTIARHVTAIVNIAETTGPFSSAPKDVTMVVPTPLDLVAGASSPFPVQTPDAIPPEQVDAIKAGKLFLYVWGHVDYTDLFGHPRKTTFCAKYNPQNNPESADACPFYNSVD